MYRTCVTLALQLQIYQFYSFFSLRFMYVDKWKIDVKLPMPSKFLFWFYFIFFSFFLCILFVLLYPLILPTIIPLPFFTGCFLYRNNKICKIRRDILYQRIFLPSAHILFKRTFQSDLPPLLMFPL